MILDIIKVMVSVNIKHLHSNRLTVDMGLIVSAGMSTLTFLMFSVCKCVRVLIEVRCDNLQPLTSICFSFTVPFSSLKTVIRYTNIPQVISYSNTGLQMNNDDSIVIGEGN